MMMGIKSRLILIDLTTKMDETNQKLKTLHEPHAQIPLKYISI